MTWLVLAFVSLGTAYLLMSVGVSIYRRRHAIPTGATVGESITVAEVGSCMEELDDVYQGLQKHLENFHHLLGRYDPNTAKDWSDEAAVWRGQWKALGHRCRFHDITGTALRKEREGMSAAYEDLGETQEVYTRSLLRFGKEQAPRLDRIRAQMRTISERLSKAAAQEGER